MDAPTSPVVLCPGCHVPMVAGETQIALNWVHRTHYKCHVYGAETERLYSTNRSNLGSGDAAKQDE